MTLSIIIILGYLSFIQGNEQPPQTLSNLVKTHIEQDPLAVQFLTKIWTDSPNESTADLLHLVFTHAYLASQIYASETKDGSLTLNLVRDPDVYQFEYMTIMEQDEST